MTLGNHTDDLEGTNGEETLYEVNSFVFGSEFLLWLPAAKLVFGKCNLLIVLHLYIPKYKKNNPFKVGYKITGGLLLERCHV